MKKHMNKKVIFSFILGVLVTSVAAVEAVTYIYQSEQISYSSNNDNVTDVKGALDELYAKSNNSTETEYLLKKYNLSYEYINGDLVMPLMYNITDYTSPTGDIITSSDEYLVSTSLYRRAYYAFDNNTNTVWDTDNRSLTSWISYEFSLKTKIYKTEVIVFTNNTANITGNVLLQISEDGTNWKDIKTMPFVVKSKTNNTLIFELDNYIKTKYIRYVITSNVALNVSGAYEGGIRDIQVYGNW